LTKGLALDGASTLNFRGLGPAEQWSPGLQKARAYEILLLDIIMGVLPPGAKLDDLELSERYDVGLASVRDALGRLALEGLVDRRPRIGTTVAPLDMVEIRQAFEARCMIEPHCAALAAVRATEDEIQAMTTAFDGAEEAAARKDFALLVSMDQTFHRAVAIGSHNPALIRIVGLLHHKAARYWVHTLATNQPEAHGEGDNAHLAVARAIADRDPAAASAAMYQALSNFPDRVGRAAGQFSAIALVG
jgi:DNA-binding GntR family transcriptional regulator